MPKIDAYPQGAPCFVQLMTPDQAAAKQFYGELFGWSMFETPLSDEGDYYLSAMLGEEFVAGISYFTTPELTGHPAFWAVFLAVDDVDATAARVAGLGGEVEGGPFDVMTFGRMAMIKDPTDARVNLWQAAESPGTTVRDEVGAPSWNELVSPDLDTATAFYADLLGVTWSPMEMEGMDYRLLQVGGKNVGGAMPPMPEGVPPHWNVYFYVADVDDTVAAVERLGGRALAPAFDVPTVGRMACVTDPQGGMFWVMHELEAA